MASTARVAMAGLLAGSLLLIIAATTMPWSAYYVGHAHWASVEWVPFSRRVRPGDFLLNVLLFAPFGYAGWRVLLPADDDTRLPPTVRRTVVALVVAGGLLSMAVELFQVYCHWRTPTTVDVMSNTIGTWAGTWWARRSGR